MPRDQKVGRPLILALVITVGLGVAWAWLAVSAGVTVEQFLPSHYVSRLLTVVADGTPYISFYQRDCGSQAQDLDGKQVELEGPESTINGAQLDNGAKPAVHWSWAPPGWNSLAKTFYVSGMREQLWYMIHDGQREGRAYFVGYDRTTCQCLGYLGLSGWQQELPEPDRCFPIALTDYSYHGNGVTSGIGRYHLLGYYSFAHDYELRWPSWAVAVRMGSKILMVNLRDKTVQPLLDDPAIVSITCSQRPSDGGRDFQQLLAVRFPEKVAYLSLEGKPVTEYAIPEEFRAEPLAIYLLPDNKTLFATCRHDPMSGHDEATLLWTTPAGEVLERKELTLTEAGPNRTARLQGVRRSAACPVPGIMAPALVFGFGPLAEKSRHPEWSYGEAFRDSLRQLVPVLVGLFLLGAALSWACIRRQRKYALPWTKTWAAFVFFFGVPGYLAYLCHRRWPVRAECPACHTPSPQDREACIQCDSSFPAPAPKGIEIFA
ncbi:MAG: hypothetical protein GXX96_24780 [Planctomycetaceae bacterium]|nr:hypothetical protein [Planctomycetaceae bacterium]